MHFLSLLAIFKNESHILEEWVDHYIKQGIDHFYLIDNGSDDQYEKIIEKFSHKITLFKDNAQGIQPKLYWKYMESNLKNTQWLLVCDLDEFVWGVDYTLKDIIKNIKDEKIGQIQVPWERFGSSGHIKQPKNVVQSFLMRKEYSGDTSPMKSIGRSNCINTIYVHDFGLNDGFYTVDSKFNEKDPKEYFKLTEEYINSSNIRCAHYQVQSRDFFMNNKAKRGKVNNEMDRTEQFFKDHDTNDIYDDKLFRKNNQIIYIYPVIVFIMFLFFFLLYF